MQAGAEPDVAIFVLLGLVAFAAIIRASLRSHREGPPPEARGLPDPSPSPQRRPPPALPPVLPVLPSLPAPFTAKAFVVDGDTICFDRGRLRVRLFGIDAPEMSQFGGKAARGHLIRMIGGRRVLVRPVDIDRYGRVVARLHCGGTDVCQAMVEDGYAVAMPAYCRDYLEVERAARRDRRGLWKASADWGIKDPSRHRRIERWKAGAGGR